MKKYILPFLLMVATIAGVMAAFGTDAEDSSQADDTTDIVFLGELDLAERAEILRNQYRRMTPGDEPLVQDVGAWPTAWEEFGSHWGAAPATRDLATWLVPFSAERAGNGSGGRDTNLSEPSNRPDDGCNDTYFVFVHGYSVNAEQARAWNAEMFKRLHQSGSNAKFVAVDWWGDESQTWVPFVGTITPDYYVNVEHAFATASSLAVSINQMLPGRKVVAAHSLGNVLVASAIVDYGLVASSNFMFNAAVPVEAFADVPVETNMVNPDWRDYASYLWASKWHEAFLATDGRHALSWRGCFATLTNYCNFYSSTEDVLDNVGASIPYPQRQWA